LADLDLIGCKAINASIFSESSVLVKVEFYKNFTEIAKKEDFIYYSLSTGDKTEFIVYFPKEGSLICYVKIIE